MINWIASNLPANTNDLGLVSGAAMVILGFSTLFFLVAVGTLLSQVLQASAVVAIMTGVVAVVAFLVIAAANARKSAIEAAERLERAHRGY